MLYAKFLATASATAADVVSKRAGIFLALFFVYGSKRNFMEVYI